MAIQNKNYHQTKKKQTRHCTSKMVTEQVKLDRERTGRADLVQKVSEGKTLHFHPTLLKYFYAKIK